MGQHTLNLTAFRTAFPAFSNTGTFPDSMLNAYFSNASSYISAWDNYSGLNGATLDWALQLLTAHLAQSFVLIGLGKTNIVIAGSGVAKVNVSLKPPPDGSAIEWWLATTPYGIQLWALLDVNSVGGWVIGGLPESSAFRKVGGVF